MNQQQMHAAYLKAENQRLASQVEELTAHIQDKSLIDRLIIAAVNGASARLSEPGEVAQFAIKTAEALLEVFKGAEILNAEAKGEESK